MRTKLFISILAAALALPAAAACGTGGGFFFVEDPAEGETSVEDEAPVGDDALSAEPEAQPDEAEAIESGDEAAAEDAAEAEEAVEYYDEALNGDDAFDIVAQKVVTADYSGNTSVYVVADDGRVYDFGYVALDTDILLIARGDSLRITATSTNVVKAWDFTLTGEEDAKARIHDVIEETEEDTDETEEESSTGYGSLWWSGSGDSGN